MVDDRVEDLVIWVLAARLSQAHDFSQVARLQRRGVRVCCSNTLEGIRGMRADIIYVLSTTFALLGREEKNKASLLISLLAKSSSSIIHVSEWR